MAVVASVNWVKKDLGANHFMWTRANLHDNGWIVGDTRTATFTNLGGFRAYSIVTVQDEIGRVIAKTPANYYGVDGRWIGRSDRTDRWQHNLGTAVARPGVKLVVLHSWDSIKIEDWIKTGQKLLPFLAIFL